MNTPQAAVGAGLSLMAFRAQGPKVEETLAAAARLILRRLHLPACDGPGP
jgi:hypothetical protein